MNHTHVDDASTQRLITQYKQQPAAETSMWYEAKEAHPFSYKEKKIPQIIYYPR